MNPRHARIGVAFILILTGCGGSERTTTLQVNGLGAANVSITVNGETTQQKVKIAWEGIRAVPADATIAFTAQLIPDLGDQVPMLACVLKNGETRIDDALDTGPAATVTCSGIIP